MSAVEPEGDTTWLDVRQALDAAFTALTDLQARYPSIRVSKGFSSNSEFPCRAYASLMESTPAGEEYFAVSVDWHRTGDDIELSSDVSDGEGRFVAAGPSERFRATPKALADSLQREVPALQDFIREQAEHIANLLAHVVGATDLPAEAQTNRWQVPSGIAGRIQEFIDASVDLIVLPSLARGEEYYYAPDDIPAALEVRAAGLRVALADASNPRFLHEFSAGETITIAIAVMENLTASGLIAVGRYLLARAGLILKHGLSLSGDVDLDVRVARVMRTSGGDVAIEGLHVRGEARAATTAVLTALGGHAAADAAMSQMDTAMETGEGTEAHLEEPD